MERFKTFRNSTESMNHHHSAHFHVLLSALVPDVCLKDTMSVADSVYNLQLIKEFCESNLQSCCPLAVEDLLYAPPALHVGIQICHSDDDIAKYQI